MVLDAAALEETIRVVIVGALLSIRAVGVLIVAPVFSHPGIPVLVKGMLALVIAAALVPSVPPQPTLELHPWVLAFLAFKEALVGLMIGFLSSGVLYAARFAGGMLDLDIGFQTALLFDPGLGGFPTLIGEFFALTTLVLFFWLDGHQALLLALRESVHLIPLTTVVVPTTGEELIRWASSVTALALSLAAPTVAALFVSIWVLALLGRGRHHRSTSSCSAFRLKRWSGLGCSA
ncbi:MAG: flagellar biosynthetic protein FliR [Candidatus Kapabacteria bacterium]|nr:flagellar biosynthetic protein FliR [Candidatus Kapabacteria bacterium]MDW8011757.1 flagellar biosynthetic protein FliR [Bacteroidota bacterium]